jgi:hypothetical protein
VAIKATKKDASRDQKVMVAMFSGLETPQGLGSMWWRLLAKSRRTRTQRNSAVVD